MSANWNSLRMLSPGIVPPEKWNALVDAVRAATVSSFVGGKFAVTGLGTLLEGGTGQGAAAYHHPFQIYPAPFAGSGSPPPDQFRRVRVRPGTVNNVKPSNGEAEFVMAQEYTWIYATIDFDYGGSGAANVIAVALGSGSSIPDNPPPSVEGPSRWHIGLGQVQIENGAVTRIDQFVQHSLWATVVLTEADCEHVYRTAFFNAI